MKPFLFSYCGGKSRLYTKILPFIQQVYPISPSQEFNFYECFSGGGGFFLNFATDYPKAKLFLNDLDENMYCFWKVIVDQDSTNFNLLKNKINNTSPTTELFYELKDKILGNNLDKAFHALFFNKTSFSGKMKDAHPIGGVNQTGNWKIDCKWNKINLVKKLNIVRELLKNRTVITNLHFRDFFNTYNTDNGFVYSDAPYRNMGPKIYSCFMNDSEHAELSKILLTKFNWLASYDNDEFIKSLYKYCNIKEIEMIKSLAIATNGKRNRINELIIFPNRMSYIK